MAVYAIGDLQGCYDALQKLLDLIEFDERRDQLWFTGDLVNRGPDSLKSLRFIKSLDNAAVTVLGNHDLHLLAVATTSQKQKKRDTLDEILSAPDRDELIDWLRNKPLLYHTAPYFLIHAGLPPQWDSQQTKYCAAEVESVLHGPDYPQFLAEMYGNTPDRWHNKLEGIDRLRFITNCFTRMRYCDQAGRLDFQHKGPPGNQPPELVPWFQAPHRKSSDMKIIFGHWSTLGLYQENQCYGIDTGCLWGGKLTALRLPDGLQDELVISQYDCSAASK